MVNIYNFDYFRPQCFEEHFNILKFEFNVLVFKK